MSTRKAGTGQAELFPEDTRVVGVKTPAEIEAHYKVLAKSVGLRSVNRCVEGPDLRSVMGRLLTIGVAKHHGHSPRVDQVTGELVLLEAHPTTGEVTHGIATVRGADGSEQRMVVARIVSLAAAEAAL